MWGKEASAVESLTHACMFVSHYALTLTVSFPTEMRDCAVKVLSAWWGPSPQPACFPWRLGTVTLKQKREVDLKSLDFPGTRQALGDPTLLGCLALRQPCAEALERDVLPTAEGRELCGRQFPLASAIKHGRG